MNRLCPVCKIEMSPLYFANHAEIDFCKNCGGLWFDHEELDHAREADSTIRKILEQKRFNPSPLLCRECGSFNTRHSRNCGLCGKDLRLLCPSCSQNLDEVKIGSLTADRCSRCKGVWLDGGELAALFREFQAARSALASRSGSDDKRFGGPTTGDVADLTLTALVWSPELFYLAAAAMGKVASEVPGLLAKGVELAGDAPELAGKAVELSGEAISGAIELASKVPEAAGSLVDLFTSFIEALFGLLSD